jgi:tricorn protease-like protein
LPAATDAPTPPIATENDEFTRDGKGLLVTTDRDGEFQRSAFLDFATGKLDYFGPDNWDTEELAVSPDGKTIAAITNEAGVGILRLYAADTRRELPRPAVAIGTVKGVRWHDNSRLLAFNLDSARSPGDVYALDAVTGKVER